jgi:hypothetical protein
LANPPVKRDRHAIKFSTTMPSINNAALVPVAIGLLLPAVQQVRVAAARISSTNNLKFIGLAMLNYESDFGVLPPAAICDKKGKPLLSWRVAILPYIEQTQLYEQFKLDEPWDSEHNKKLISQMPKTYMNPLIGPQPGMTDYRVFYGKDTAMGLQKSRTLAEITDGASNTMLACESADSVIWTKPDDFAYDKKKPLPKFFSLTPAGFRILMCDGLVRTMPLTTPEKTMRWIIEANDGETVEFPGEERLPPVPKP